MANMRGAGKMLLKIQAFKMKQKLNICMKAIPGNDFKLKLLDTDYDPAYVDASTNVLVHKC